MFIVKVPGINGLGKTKGCERAGNEIIAALREIHSSESGKPIDVNLLDLEEIHLDNSNLELTNKLIQENSLKAFETRSRTIFLGGDHSISYSIGKRFLDYCQNSEKEPCLIIFDSHADCMPVMREPTHEEWLRAVIEAGFPVENILLIGASNLWKDEIEFLAENKVQRINTNLILEDIDNVADTIMEFTQGREVYISIDIDVIDPSCAPATGYPTPGGLTSKQFLCIIQRLSKIKTLRAVDIVEINPDKDVNGMTVQLGAKILGEFI